jgi:hypothetical protein
MILAGDKLSEGWRVGGTLNLPRLRIEPLQGAQFLIEAEPGALNRGFQHLDGVVIHSKRYRKRVPVLAAVREGEPCRIGKAVGGSVHDFGDHGQRRNGAPPNPANEDQFGKVHWPSIGRRCEAAVQAPREHVGCAHLVMRRHDKMRQQWLRRSL